MARILPRILMWVFIIAAVWYFAQQQRPGVPDAQQEQAMLDAARHYRRLQAEAAPEVPAVAPDETGTPSR